MFIVVNSINQEHNHTHTFCLHTHTKAIENGRRLEEEEEKSFVVMLYSLVVKIFDYNLFIHFTCSTSHLLVTNYPTNTIGNCVTN
jgi:hypothetical protein